MENTIRASVIVPVFNVYPYIDKCLQSICEQTEKDIEIICVYTQSKDGTFEKLEEWAQKDSRIQIITRNDGGLGGARNTGMDHATGQYIVFVDSDDWIEPNMVEDTVALAEKLGSDAVIFPFRSYDEQKKTFVKDGWGSSLPFPKKLTGHNFTINDITPKEFVSPDAPVTAWNKLYRTEFIQKEKMRFIEECRYEDNPFYYELMCKGKISIVQTPYYNYRVNRAGSLQNSSSMDESVFDIIIVMKKINDMLLDSGISSPYYKEFYHYMLDEFSWRFQILHGNKRRFLEKIHKSFQDQTYQDLLSTLSRLGVNTNSPLFQKVNAPIPQVSVVIPVYNNAKDIRECLNSVLEQQEIQLEIFCIDDCSQDETVALVKAYCAKDDRVHLICKQQNSGAGISRNIALDQVNGEFLFFLDGDDLLPDPYVLQKMYFACKQNKKLTSAGNMQCFFNDDRKQLSAYIGTTFHSRKMALYKDYIPHPTWGFTRFLFNYEVILEHGIRFPEWRYYEDPLFFVKYMSACPEFCTILDCVYLYRQKADGKEVFSEQKFLDLFASEKMIFPLLLKTDKQVYFAEYRTFLQFCEHLKNYLQQNPKDSVRLTQGANEVFSLIKFDDCSQVAPDVPIYDSFEQYLDGRNHKAAGQGVFHGRKTFKQRMKKIAKRILKPFYKPIHSRFAIPIWESRAGIQQIESQILQLMSMIEEQNSKIQQIEQKEACIGQTADHIERRINFGENSLRTIRKMQKKVFLLGTSDHSNIGDAAIAVGSLEFIRRYFSEYEPVEISTYEINERYSELCALCSPDDLIFLQGGGNLGNRFMSEENLRRKVIADFPNNHIVILPQTIYFDDDAEASASAEIYTRHKNLQLFTRGKESLSFAQNNFPQIPSASALDMALILQRDYCLKRQGILLCIRDLTDESGLTKEEYLRVIQTVANCDPSFEKTNNLYTGDIPRKDREFVVYEELKRFARHRVVVTDRLHGLIFSIVTQTPCVVISAFNQKIREFSADFGNSNAVFFLDRKLDEIADAVQKAMEVEQPQYPILTEDAFANIAAEIREKGG